MENRYNSSKNDSGKAINDMKNNIRRLMKEKGITQTALSEMTGIEQPRISSVLNTKSCFTVEQLVQISDALNVSVDEILGRSINRESGRDLEDICSMLFEIDKITPIKFFAYEDNTYIYFGDKILSGIIKEWAEVVGAQVASFETKCKIVQMWKNDTLEKIRKGEFFVLFNPKEVETIQALYDSRNPHKKH